METINYSERLNALIKRRNVDMNDVKYRGKLRTSKWDMFEASQKRHLVGSLVKSLLER